MQSIQETILKTTSRGKEIKVNLQIYNSTAHQDRQQFMNALQALAKEKQTQLDESRTLSLKLPGTTTIAEIKSSLERHINQKIILMCEQMVPNPLDVIGDLLATVQKQELTIHLSASVIAG